MKIKHGDLTETQINRIDTVVYHILEISGGKTFNLLQGQTGATAREHPNR